MDGPEAIAEHLTSCRGQDAATVVDGSADKLIAGLLAAGWTWQEGGPDDVDSVAGKRIRYLRMPELEDES